MLSKIFKTYPVYVYCMNCFTSNNYSIRKGKKPLGIKLACSNCKIEGKVRLGQNKFDIPGHYIN